MELQTDIECPQEYSYLQRCRNYSASENIQKLARQQQLISSQWEIFVMQILWRIRTLEELRDFLVASESQILILHSVLNSCSMH